MAFINNHLPTREEAERLLEEAEALNVGAWGNHSRNVAICAEKIALACGMDGEKAYILGLLHDIGRRFGIKHLGHVYDGWKYMLELGYPQVAQICLTHSFGIRDINTYIGKFDILPDEQKELEDALKSAEYDDYDRLIQISDALGAADGVVDIEERMEDVKKRYGCYPQEKWDKNIELKEYFEKLAGKNIYEIVKG
ncbi:MAG: HD domain-containing protein [Clostridia bacterium]|nr:HD domain-containing protein [Clostridia bacterium]